MGLIRVSDEVLEKLKKTGNGRTMTATIKKLLEGDEANSNKAIIEAIERLSKKVDLLAQKVDEGTHASSYSSSSSYPSPSTPAKTSSLPEPPFPMSGMEPAPPKLDYVVDRSYSEIIEEVNQVQEELKSLEDQDSDRGKELKNKIRALNVELSMVDEDDD